jgi:hypothetical protein
VPRHSGDDETQIVDKTTEGLIALRGRAAAGLPRGERLDLAGARGLVQATTTAAGGDTAQGGEGAAGGTSSAAEVVWVAMLWSYPFPPGDRPLFR